MTFENCKRSGCTKKAARKQIYCSQECAPLGRLSRIRESNTSSEPTAAFSLKAAGGQFPKLLNGGLIPTLKKEKPFKPILSTEFVYPNARKAGDPAPTVLEKLGIENGGQGFPQSSAPQEIENERRPEKMTETETESSAPGMQQSEPTILKPSQPAAIEETQPAQSTGQLLSLEEGKLASLSLIDDATGRLHLQMKRLTLNPQTVKGAVDPIEASYSERQRAGLAIKTAAEIRQLIKLKLDAVKVFKLLKETK